MEPHKIIEISSDADDDDEFIDCEKGDSDDEGVPLKFKQSVLKNKSIFEKQLLESTEIDPSEVFEIESKQENVGDYQDLDNKMDLLVLELADGGDAEDEDENKLLTLSTQMTPIPDCNGIFKKITKTGQGACPPPDSIVTVHFNAYIQDEINNQIKSFDSTVLRGNPKSFMRGQGEVIMGLDEAVGTMKRNEESEFIFSPDWAFGDMGCPPRIPPKAYVYFKIDLIDWIDSSAAEAFGKLSKKKRQEVSFEKVLEAAKSEKEKAKSFFEKQNFLTASKCYRNALNWVQERGYADEEEENRGQELCLKLLLDLALVNLKLNKPKITCTYCKEALEIPTKKLYRRAKAHYRYGLAQEKLGDYVMASKSMEKALKIVPKDSSVTRALMELNKNIRKQEHIEKDLYRKMLGLPAETTEKVVILTEESHKAIRRQLADFLESNEEKISFPQGLSESERTFLKEETARLNLYFSRKPMKQGEDFFVISKH